MPVQSRGSVGTKRALGALERSKQSLLDRPAVCITFGRHEVLLGAVYRGSCHRGSALQVRGAQKRASSRPQL